VTTANRIGQILLIFGFVGLIAAILFPVFAQRKNGHGPRCISHIKQLALGMLIYADANDDLLPLRDLWMDAVQPYVKRPIKDMRCNKVVEEKLPGYGYAFNSLLERKPSTQVKAAESTIMLYDSINYGKNASDPLLSLPKPGRHDGRNMIAFLDGHARSKEYKP
jgi:prepilin-type processing-associated H-X9-DG protein